MGIDFGTSNSAVAALVDNKNQVLPDEKGNRLTPSVVSFGKNKQVLIGADAKTQGVKNPKRTIHSIKRLIGRKIFSEEIKKAQVLLPYELVEGKDQNVAVKIDDQVYAPQEIAAIIIKRMKQIADHALQSEVSEAVITVPAYFNDSQRQATKEACQIAGLDALRMINEPTAAALAYGFGKGLSETIVVYDLGGGTFDLSILRLKDKVFEVIGTAGDTFLGGDDFDDRIIDIIAEDFLKKTQVDLRSIPQALPLLRSNAEKTKRRLSYAERSDLYIPGVVQKEGKTLDLHFSLSRDQLRQNTKDLIQKTFTVCDEALNAANIKPSQVDAVILVGGPTKMPLISDAAESYFGQKPLSELNPDEVVSMGASIQASSLKAKAPEKKALLLDVTPLDLGVATVGGYVETLVEKNTPIPADAKKAFTTTSDLQEQVDIRIYQGKNRRIEDSHLLGEFRLSGFEKKKAGEVTIDVSFSIDTDGIVNVTAFDKETGATQNVSVKLSAAMGSSAVAESAEKTKDYQEVKLKDKYEGAEKVLVYRCAKTAVSSEYIEGYIKDFKPEAEEFEVINENQAVSIPRSELGWVCIIEDFSNIPRYIKALSEKPSADAGAATELDLHQISFKNGVSIFGQGHIPEQKDTGFWISPYFKEDNIGGKLFVNSAQVQDTMPVQI